MNNYERPVNEMTGSTIIKTEKKYLKNEWKDISILKDYYVYHLVDPHNNLPFYVGKGRLNRMYNHEKCVLNGKFPNNNAYLFYKILKILKDGRNVIYKKLFNNLKSEEALLLEVKEIKKYGRRDNNTGILCNMTDGGDGNNNRIVKQSTRDKLSCANKNRIINWGAKISFSLKKDPETLINRAKKISLANKGRVTSTETKHKQSLSHIGKRDSDETKKKKSESQKIRIYTPFEIERIRNMGKKNIKILDKEIINHVKLFNILLKKPHNVYEVLSQIYTELTYLDVRKILKSGEYSSSI